MGRRGITRGELWAHIAAVAVLCAATLICSWGLLSWALDRGPVATPGVWVLAPALAISLALMYEVWIMWRVSLTLLRGLTVVPVGHMFAAAAAAVLLWWGIGALAGMPLSDSLFSPFVAALAGIWLCAVLLLWALVFRRLYTERPVPDWSDVRYSRDEDVAE